MIKFYVKCKINEYLIKHQNTSTRVLTISFVGQILAISTTKPIWFDCLLKSAPKFLVVRPKILKDLTARLLKKTLSFEEC